MAWNPSPEVAAARDIARKLGADRIIAFYTTSDGRCGYVSYGQTRAKCDQTRKVADACYRHVGQEFAEVIDGARPHASPMLF